MPKASNSPLFKDVISWLEKKNVARLRAFFPLGTYRTWEREYLGGHFKDVPYTTRVEFTAEGPRVIYRKSILDELRGAIRKELAEPLFLSPGLNVRFEAEIRRRRQDNAYCCLEFYRRQLARVRGADLETCLCAFKEDFHAALPGARFPFSWMIDHRDPAAKEWDELEKHKADFNRRINQEFQGSAVSLDELAERDGAAQRAFQRKAKDLAWVSDMALSRGLKRTYALHYCEWLLTILKFNRGKPGRHPKEFNVLVYHVIRKCTGRKLDWKRRAAGLSCDVMRKDGQHRLETDWKLVTFLLLDLHIHTHRIPEIARFIASHKREPAPAVFKKMQAWLLNIRKNFPPIHGWPMNKEGFPEPETGFRKLAVTEDGRLRFIRL